MDVARCGPFLSLTDCDGLRHLVRASSVQIASDADQARDETILVVAGRPLRVPVALDELLPMIQPSVR